MPSRPPPLPDPLLGATIDGRFRVERHLSAGGFGSVYQGVQLSIARPVAIKVLSLSTGDAAAPARFAREARALGRLTGPNIVRVIDYGRLPDSRYYLVMELLDGCGLDALLARGPMAIDEALHAGIQLCRALEEAHGAGIVHRDLKPANVFVQRVGAGWLVKLLDFGAALTAGDPALTAAYHVVGTPSFLSPEQIQGEPADARSDLYGVGLVLFEMLTGEPPFVAEETIEVLFQHLHDRPLNLGALRPEVPPALAELVERLLAKSPDERPQSAAQVRSALMAISAPSAPILEDDDEPVWEDPHPRWALFAALGVAAMLLGGLWMTVAGSSGSTGQPVAESQRADASSAVYPTVFGLAVGQVGGSPSAPAGAVEASATPPAGSVEPLAPLPYGAGEVTAAPSAHALELPAAERPADFDPAAGTAEDTPSGMKAPAPRSATPAPRSTATPRRPKRQRRPSQFTSGRPGRDDPSDARTVGARPTRPASDRRPDVPASAATGARINPTDTDLFGIAAD